MKPTEILNTLISGMEVKVKEEIFNSICEPYKDNLSVNCLSNRTR